MMAKTDWQMGDTVQPDDLNRLGQEINGNAADIAHHRSAAVLDHPDGSVTTEKLADGAVTAAKVAADVARTADLGAHVSETNGVHGATSAATPNRIVQRDAAGRFKASAPAAADDVARKAEVDAMLPKTGGEMTGDIRFRVNPGEWKGMKWFAGDSEIWRLLMGGDAQNLYIQRAGDGAVVFHIAADGTLRSNNNVLWHAGNDGPGSGLEADKVPGYGIGVTNGKDISGTDLNNLSGTGFYIGTNLANSPNPGNYYYIIHHQWSSSGALQLLFRNSANYQEAFYRAKASGVWHPWLKLWNSGNDGAGSGLDADLIQGMNPNRFIFGDNARGTTNYSGDLDAVTKSGFYYATTGHANSPTGGNGHFIHVQAAGNNDNAFQLFMIRNTNNFYMRRKQDGAWQNWVEIYNASSLASDRIRKITISTSAPSGGSNGDIWIQY